MTLATITVLGSANMDLVVTVDRTPRLGETVAGHGFRTVPGGKGANQALAAARAGGEVAFLGAVGDDAHGEQIRTLLDADGVDVAGLVTSAEPTGTAHIVVDAQGGNSIVVVPGANGTVTRLTDVHRAAIADCALLLLQLELPARLVAEAAAFARSVGVRTVLTPSPAENLARETLGSVDVLVPNEHELALISEITDPLAAARSLDCDVLVTLGAQGSMWVNGDDVVKVPAFDVDVVDTTAAGDTFVGTYAVALVDGMEPAVAMLRASAAAALSVGRLGASPSMPTRDEIDVFLDAHPA